MEQQSSNPDVDRAAYGELKDSVIFIQRNEQLSLAIENIQKTLLVVNNDYKNYSSYTLGTQARYDGLLAYCVNTLIWMYHKLTDATGMTESIHGELQRVRSAMDRTKEVCLSQTERPRLNQPAAKRFIRAGLYDANKPGKSTDTPPNKKKRFED